MFKVPNWHLKHKTWSILSFQEVPGIIAGEDFHLSNGHFVEFGQSFGLREAFFDHHRVYAFHIRQANQFVYRSIVPDVSLQVMIRVPPFLGRHSEQSDIQYVCLGGIDIAQLIGSDLIGNEISADCTSVDVIVDLCQLAFGAPAYFSFLG